MTSSQPTAVTDSSGANTAANVLLTATMRRPDSECVAEACQFLSTLIGAPPDDLRWDTTHRLQGHARLGGQELVVIAPRDTAHRTVVLTAQDWDQVRRADGGQRTTLLSSCAIADRDRLVAILAGTAVRSDEMSLAA